MAPDKQSDPEQAIERDTENLEKDLGKLGSHIDEAKGHAARSAKQAGHDADEPVVATPEADSGDDD